MAATERTIFLARHGETEWNRIGRWQGATDIPLSDVGRGQALVLAQRLAGAGVRRVYASDLARARETAEIIAAAWGLEEPVVLDVRLRERGYGCFEGLTREECAVRFPGAWERYQADRRLVPPDAEPQEQIIARTCAVMNEIGARTEADLPSLVISHGGTIRSFVHAAVGVVLPPLGNVAMVRLRYAGKDSFVLEQDQPPPEQDAHA